MKSLYIEPLLEEQEVVAQVAPSDLAEARAFRSESRRREFLSWRAVVRRELGPGIQIAYNAVGAPVVSGRAVHIGVSHCRNRVAVCISDEPCAVDIESTGRNFLRAAPRYLSPAEGALCDDPQWPALVWCAKETLYKFSGREGLDLLRDVHIEAVDLAAGRLTGRIENGEPVGLSVSRSDEHVVVYIL